MQAIDYCIARITQYRNTGDRRQLGYQYVNHLTFIELVTLSIHVPDMKFERLEEIECERLS